VHCTVVRSVIQNDLHPVELLNSVILIAAETLIQNGIVSAETDFCKRFSGNEHTITQPYIGSDTANYRLSGLSSNGTRVMQSEGDGNGIWSTDAYGSTETRPLNYTVRI
jgi:hypothetical protein